MNFLRSFQFPLSSYPASLSLTSGMVSYSVGGGRGVGLLHLCWSKPAIVILFGFNLISFVKTQSLFYFNFGRALKECNELDQKLVLWVCWQCSSWVKFLRKCKCLMFKSYLTTNLQDLFFLFHHMLRSLFLWFGFSLFSLQYLRKVCDVLKWFWGGVSPYAEISFCDLVSLFFLQYLCWNDFEAGCH